MKRFILRELAVLRNHQQFFFKENIETEKNRKRSIFIASFKSFIFKVKLLKIFRDLCKFHLLSLNWSNILLDIKVKKNWRLILNFLSKFASKIYRRNFKNTSKNNLLTLLNECRLKKKKGKERNIVKSLKENIDISIYSRFSFFGYFLNKNVTISPDV